MRKLNLLVIFMNDLIECFFMLCLGQVFHVGDRHIFNPCKLSLISQGHCPCSFIYESIMHGGHACICSSLDQHFSTRAFQAHSCQTQTANLQLLNECVLAHSSTLWLSPFTFVTTTCSYTSLCLPLSIGR